MELLDDKDFRSFIIRESNDFYKSIKQYNKLIKTNLVKIIALSQFGQAHEVSLYAAVKRDITEIRFYEEVLEKYPIFQEWSIRYGLNPKTIILAVITSIIYERKMINKTTTVVKPL